MLHGLSTLTTGGGAACTLLALTFIAAGLVVVRCTSPTEIRFHLERTEERAPKCVAVIWQLTGLCGLALIYIGLSFASVPMMRGLTSDLEAKAIGIIMSMLLPICWAIERFMLLRQPLPSLQTCASVVVWFASALVDWAAPRPYDDMSLGLAGQVAGCDGGFRSPFLVFATVWPTSILFGTIFLFFEEGTTLSSCCTKRPRRAADALTPSEEDPEHVPHSFRRKALPAIFAFAMSMSGFAFGVGAAEENLVFFVGGCSMLLLAVVCIWDWLWRLEFSLGSLAPLFMSHWTLLRTVQGHLTFRDFRWDPEDTWGPLIMWEHPGLHFFIFGIVITFAVCSLYVYTSDMKQWVAFTAADVRANQKEEDDEEDYGPRWQWQWVVLPFSMLLCGTGIVWQLVHTSFTFPVGAYLSDDYAVQKFKSSPVPGNLHTLHGGESYSGVIHWLYHRHLPCSAMVVAYNSMILPPIQFAGLIVVLLRPRWVSSDILSAIRVYLIRQAPTRFTNPFILMLMVAFLNLSGPGKPYISAGFSHGFWIWILYCTISLTMAWSVQEPEADLHPPVRRSLDHKLYDDNQNPYSGLMRIWNKSRMSAEGTMALEDPRRGFREEDLSDEEAGAWRWPKEKGMEVAATLLLTGVLFASLTTAVVSPYLEFTYRLGGVALIEMNPTVLDLWQSLFAVNWFLGIIALVTMVLLPFTWSFCLCVRVVLEHCRHPRLVSQDPHAWLTYRVKQLEPNLRSFVTLHAWALGLILVYYIITARNQAVVELCSHIPRFPLGLAAMMILGVTSLALQALAKTLGKPKHLKSRSFFPQLPGGMVFWGGGPFLMMCGLLALALTHGPTLVKDINNVADVNSAFFKLLPAANQNIREQLPENVGQCSELYLQQLGSGDVAYTGVASDVYQHCAGEAPVAHHSSLVASQQMDVVAKWIKGLNTLRIVNAQITPPPNASVPVQHWSMVVTGVFDQLRVYVNMSLNGEAFFEDYICCDQPFHFTIQAEADCVQGEGFQPVQLSVPYMDEIELQSHSKTKDAGGNSFNFNVDFGRSEEVEDEIKAAVMGKSGKFLFKSKDGAVMDPLMSGSSVFTEIIRLNAGHRCVTSI